MRDTKDNARSPLRQGMGAIDMSCCSGGLRRLCDPAIACDTVSILTPAARAL